MDWLAFYIQMRCCLSCAFLLPSWWGTAGYRSRFYLSCSPSGLQTLSIWKEQDSDLSLQILFLPVWGRWELNKETKKKKQSMNRFKSALSYLMAQKKAQWASHSSFFVILHSYLTGTCRKTTCLSKFFWNSLCHSLPSHPHSMNLIPRSKCFQKTHLDQQSTGETLGTDSVPCCKSMFQEKTE